MSTEGEAPRRPDLRNAVDRLGFRELVTLLTVAETGSFRRAGQRLSVGQSAISRRIQHIEDLLGVSLFERRASGARLTPAGSRFAYRARTILAELNFALEGAKSAAIGDNGQLSVGVAASLAVEPLRSVFKSFLDAHQDVEICVAESSRGELFTSLSHRRLDAVIATGEPATETGDGILLSNEDIFLAVPSDHDLASHDRLDWNDVRDATFLVSLRDPSAEIHDYMLRRVSHLGQTINLQRHGVGCEGIMTLIGLGLGVSLVADHWRVVKYPNVSFVPIGDVDDTIPISLTWRPENDNPALRRFISLARIEAKKYGVLS